MRSKQMIVETRQAIPESWLGLAESELGILSTQCLDRRIPDKQTLTSEAAAKADWQFTTADDWQPNFDPSVLRGGRGVEYVPAHE
jgi:hypothetical protein